MLISAELNRKLKQKQSETSKIPSFFISRLFVPSSRTKTQHGVPFLSTSMMPCWKFHSRCLGVCFTFTRKEIYLWAVDCWSLFISPLALRGHTQPNPAHLPLCLSVSQTASVPGLHVEGGEGRGEATQAQGVPLHTKRGNKADMTAWWHSRLCIISFLPIIWISFMWDFVLQRKVSRLLA